MGILEKLQKNLKCFNNEERRYKYEEADKIGQQ